MMNRRHLLMMSAFSVPFLAVACTTATSTSPTTGPVTIDPQVLADAQSAVQESAVIVSILQQYAPNSITPAVATDIATASASAQALIASLSTATLAPSGASILQQIENDLNIILTAAGPILKVVAAADPQLAPAVIAYDVIMPLVPSMEAWVNLIAGQVTTAAARTPLKPLRVAYTLDQARALAAVQKKGK